MQEFAYLNGDIVKEHAITDTGYSIDSLIALGTWVGLGFVYLALAYLTFLHRWTPDAIPVSITERKTA